MNALAEVEKLGRVDAVEPIVLSLYLNVPRSPAQRPGLPPQVDELSRQPNVTQGASAGGPAFGAG